MLSNVKFLSPAVKCLTVLSRPVMMACKIANPNLPLPDGPIFLLPTRKSTRIPPGWLALLQPRQLTSLSARGARLLMRCEPRLAPLIASLTLPSHLRQEVGAKTQIQPHQPAAWSESMARHALKQQNRPSLNNDATQRYPKGKKVASRKLDEQNSRSGVFKLRWQRD